VKLTYILPFVIVFLFVTGVIYLLNGEFNNIFVLDFSPPAKVEQIPVDSLTIVENKNPDFNLTQTASSDTPAVTIDKNPQYLEVPQNLKEPGNPFNEGIPAIDTIISPDIYTADITLPENIASDSLYQKWLKSSVILYETMDAKKAANIIRNFPISTARAILYKMKKKKAAAIISEFDSETATRIMQFK
jgi:hypothetical protein